jgi:hypothetical protein
MTVTDSDPVRAFTAALSPAAHRQLPIDYTTIPLIRAGAEHRTPQELARLVGAGIGWHTPANPHQLMLFRLRREARIDDDQEDGD